MHTKTQKVRTLFGVITSILPVANNVLMSAFVSILCEHLRAILCQHLSTFYVTICYHLTWANLSNLLQQFGIGPRLNFRRLHECSYSYALDMCNCGYGHLWRSCPLVGSWLFRYKLKGTPAVSQCIPCVLFDWCYYWFDVFDHRQAFDLKHITQRLKTWIAFKCDVSTQAVHVIDCIRVNVVSVC